MVETLWTNGHSEVYLNTQKSWVFKNSREQSSVFVSSQVFPSALVNYPLAFPYFQTMTRNAGDCWLCSCWAPYCSLSTKSSSGLEGPAAMMWGLLGKQLGRPDWGLCDTRHVFPHQGEASQGFATSLFEKRPVSRPRIERSCCRIGCVWKSCGCLFRRRRVRDGVALRRSERNWLVGLMNGEGGWM